MHLAIKKYLSVSVSLAQILSSCFVNLSGADLRPRNHIQPLGNDALAPQMGNSANGRDVVNIVNPNAEGISHNKYESFDIAKDNGVILNNSQENGVSITGGYVTANPNLSSNAHLIINEIVSNRGSSLNGTLEVFGRGADVIIANENGLIVNGASFINTTGVTLTTGFIDPFNKEISVRGGNINILNGGVGVDGNYFSIISESMQLSGNIAKLDGSAVGRVNFIAGLNNVKLANDMSNPVFEKNGYKSIQKPKFAIDGNMLGSMYAGYIQFVSTQDGVGVRHLGIIRSASDIVIDSKGDITIGAGIAQNIDVKTGANLNNEGVIIADKALNIEAQTLNNAALINNEVAQKLDLSLKTSYIQAEDIKAKSTNTYNQGKIIGSKSLHIGDLNALGEFQNDGGIATNKLWIGASSFANNGVISSLDFELSATQKSLNTGNMQVNNLNVKTKDFDNQNAITSNTATLSTDNFTNSGSIESSALELDTQRLANSSTMSAYNAVINAQSIENSGNMEVNTLNVKTKDFDNQNAITSNTATLSTDNFTNSGKINSSTLELDTQRLTNSSTMSAYNAVINALSIENSGKIESENKLSVIFKDTSKNSSEILHNENGIFQSNNILSLKSGNVSIDSGFGKFSANKMLLIQSDGDILIDKTLSNIGSIGLKAKGNISNASNTLLASQNDLYLDAKAFLNNSGGYVFGNNITIEADKIDNNEDATIDAQATLTLKADVIDNNMGMINSGGDMEFVVKTLNNTGKTSGNLDFKSTAPGWLHYYFDKDYFGNRDFNASYTGYSTSNNLENQQAVIKSGGNLRISFKDGGKSDVYNNNSVIAASKNIDIMGNVYNTTNQKQYKVEDLLKKFNIESIEAKPTYFGNTGVYRLGSGNPLEILNKAKYSNDDNAGYFGLLKDLASKDPLFKSLMSKGFGINWLSENNPNQLVLNQDASVSFTPKNPAQIVAGNNINIAGDVVYNSTGSVQKINADISSIQTNLKNIQDFPSSTAEKIPQQDLPNNEESKELDTDKKTSSKEVLKSVGLSEEDILGLGSKLLFHTNSDNLNSKVNYYIETRADLVDMSKFFGSEYFFNQIGYAPSKPISVIGDAYYENRLLNYQLTQNLGYSNTLSPNDVKDFLDNAAIEQKNLGLVVGEPLSEEQVSKLDKDIVWYVNKKINGVDTLVPQLYYSKNTSLKKTAISENSTIASSGDMFLNTGMLQNQSSALQAEGVVGIKAYDEAKNIGGVISGELVSIDAKNFISQSQMGINDSGDFNTINQAKIASKGDISIQTQGDVKIQNSEIISMGKDSTINIISKEGLIAILDDTAKKTTYTQEGKEDSDSSWVSTTIASTSWSSGSHIQGDNINFKAGDAITIKGSSLAQTSKEGSINLIADGDVKILAGVQDSQVQNHTFFSGINQQSGTREYATTTDTNQKQHQAMGSSLKALGNINISAKKDLSIETSGLASDKMVNLLAEGKVALLDSQNTSTTNSSYTSYQVLGIKGGSQTQDASLSLGSLLKGGEGVFIDSKGSTHIVSSEIDGGNGDVIFTSKENLKIEAGKNTLHQEDTSYGFGIVGSANVGLVGNKASVGFGINEGSFATGQSNFDSKTLSSGKIQMDSLASADFGLEFSYNSQTTDSVHYANSNIKTGGNIVGSVTGVADIGGANLTSDHDVMLQAGSIETSKYVDTDTTHSIGFNLSIKQKGHITSSAVDTMNMIADVATNAADGKNLNAGIVAASAAGAVTNLIFNDLVGTVSTQEVGVQVSYQDSYKTSENITKLSAGGKISIQSSNGDIDLKGVAFKGDSLNLDSAKNINIAAAKNTNKENSFSFGIQGRLQESAGYSALWGSNTDIGVGGNANVAYGQKNQTSYETSSFEFKNQANITSKNDLNIIGGRISAASANVEVGGNLHIASAVDSNDSKNFTANLGGDVSLGAASNTIGKGNLALNGGGGYYYEDSKTLATQSGILTQNALDINVKGDANLQGAILSSKSKTGVFEVGKQLSISDLNLHQNSGGGMVNLSGGLSGNFGGQINIGDSKNEQSLLHSATNLSVKTDGKITINGAEALAKDIYTDTDKTQTTLSSNSFSGGDISFSGNVGQIKEILSSHKKPSHLSESPSNDNEVALLDSAKADGVQSNESFVKNEASNQSHSSSENDGLKETLVLHYSQNAEQPNFAPPSPKKQKTDATEGDLSPKAQGENPQPNVLLSASELSWMGHLSDSGSPEATSQNIAIDGKKLGAGSYGEVYLVNHEGNEYAFKVPTKEHYLANLNQEAQILGSIPAHPNIIKSEGIKEVQGQTGLLVEYVQGHKLDSVLGTLKEAYDNNKINHSEFYGSVSHLTKGILEGVNHLGNNDIVHGDIKGNNILVNADTYEPKIIDFGLARRVGDEAKAGHPAFAAPEMLDSLLGIPNQQRADTKQDVYALGQFVHQIGEGQNHLFGAAKHADPLEYAMKKRIENLHDMGKSESYQPLTKQEQNSFKEQGKYGYEGAYVQFVNGALALDPKKRSDSKDLLESNFIRDPLIGSDDVPRVLQKIGMGSEKFETLFEGHHSFEPKQLNFAPPPPKNLASANISEGVLAQAKENSSSHIAAATNPEPSHSASQAPASTDVSTEQNPSFAKKIKNFFGRKTGSYSAENLTPKSEKEGLLAYEKIDENLPQTSQAPVSTEQNPSFAKKIKNFFGRKTGSYSAENLTSKSEEDLATYGKLNELDLPLKSDFVLSEQGLLVSRDKHQKDLEKFAAMGEKVPPRVPLKQEKKKSESDKKDFEDLIDKSILEIQSLNISQSADLLGTIAVNPAFRVNVDDQSLKHYFVQLLSEVGENFPHSPESREYREITNKIYADLDTRLKNDPKIERYIRNFDPSKTKHYKKLTKRIVDHYTEALKAADLEVRPTEMKFSKKFDSAYYWAIDDAVHIPVKEAYKEIYFKNQNPTSEEVGLNLFDSVVHEMTHKQQDTFVRNIINPAIPQNIKDYASIMHLNRVYYANAKQDGYDLYRGQITEIEAFNHGENSVKKIKEFLDSKPQIEAPSSGSSNLQRNPLVQRVMNVFSKKTSPAPTDSQAMIPNPNVVAAVANPEPSHSASQTPVSADVSAEQNLSLAKKIKNFFVRKKGSYNAKDLTPKEEEGLLAYGKTNELDLPPKSDFVLSEQGLLVSRDKHQKDLEKFATMGDKVPPRAPLKKEKRQKKSESDRKDLEESIDRSIFEAQDLNLSQSAELLGSIVKNPIFKANVNEESLRHYFVELLSEVGEHFPYSRDSKEYKELTKKIYTDLDTRLKNDPKIEYYVRNFDPSKTDHYKKLTKKIVKHYTEALKNTDLKVKSTGTHFSEKFDVAFYSPNSQSINIPVKEAYKNAYFKNQNPTSEEISLNLFGSIVHEMTHSQQDIFIKNMNNPNLPQNIKDYAFIMDLNSIYYASAKHDGYNLYRGQILEIEAFNHGENTAKGFKSFLDNKPQIEAHTPEPSNSQSNPLVQRVMNVFSKKTPPAPADAQAMIPNPNVVAAASNPESSHSTSQTSVSTDASTEQSPSLAKKIKSFFVRKKGSYNAKDLTPKEEESLLTYAKTDENLPPKSDFVLSEQGLLASQNKHQKDLEKFGAMGEEIPARVPLKQDQQKKNSESDKKDFEDFIERGILEAQSLNVSQSADLVKNIAKNPVFMANSNEQKLRHYFVQLLSEVGDNFHSSNDSKEYKRMTKKIYTDLNNRLKNDPEIAQYIRNFDSSNTNHYKRLTKKIVDHYSEALKNANLQVRPTEMYFSKKFDNAYYWAGDDAVHIPVKKAFKEAYLANQNPTPEEVGLSLFDTVVHEMTHKQQDTFIRNISNPTIPQNIKDYASIMHLNRVYYAKAKRDGYELYRGQLIENEAFNHEENASKQFKEFLNSNPQPESSQPSGSQRNPLVQRVLDIFSKKTSPAPADAQAMIPNPNVVASVANPEPSHSTSQTSVSADVSTEQSPSLAKKIKNFFARKKGSYNAKDLTPKEEESLLAYAKMNENLPPKSDFVLSEQGLLASQNKHQKDLEKFAVMGEEVPPRVPLKQEKKKSTSDREDLEEFIDRSIFEAQDLNVSQSADLLGSIVKNPIFMTNVNEESLKHYFVELLSEVGTHFPYSSDSMEYKELTKKIYADLDTRLKNDPKIEYYVRNFDPSKTDHYKKLTKQVIDHYSEALKDTNLNVTPTGMKFSKKFENAHFSPIDNTVNIPLKEAYKNAYFKNQNPTSEEISLHLLNTVVHEMTHKQQNILVNNTDNPAIAQSIKDYASIIGFNSIYYAKAKHDGYHLYRGQVLETEAFNHGENTAKIFKSFLDSNPQIEAHTPEPSNSQNNPLVQRVMNVFSKKTPPAPADAQAMIPNPDMVAAVANPEPSHSASQAPVSVEQSPSLAKKIKSFFTRKKDSYNAKDLLSKSEEESLLSYAKTNELDLPPKSDFVLSEQGLLASQNKHQKDLEKFATMGEEVPPRAPLKQEKKKSESDRKDFEDFIDRSIFEVQDLNVSQSADLLGSIVKNPIFMTNSNEETLRRYFVQLLSEIGENFPHSRDSREYKELTKKIYADLDTRLKNDPKIEYYVRNFDPSNTNHYKKLTKQIVNHYSEALKNTDLKVRPTGMFFSKKFESAYYWAGDDAVHIPLKEAYKNSYFKNQNPTSEEVGLSLFNAVVHEMTHKQQNTFMRNMDNPAIAQNIRDYAFIMDLNRIYYANHKHDGYELYRGQVLEIEAFNHGENAAEDFKNLLDSKPQREAHTPERSNSQSNPLVQRVLNVFSKKTPPAPADAQSMIPNPDAKDAEMDYFSRGNKNLSKL